MTRVPGRSLFDEVVAATGLALMIGPGAVQRALAAVGVTSPEAATVADYQRALPELENRMRFYMSPAEVARHLEEINLLLT